VPQRISLLNRSLPAGQEGGIMVVERCVVVMVLERGETRHDVVVNGLKEIALCGKVIASSLSSLQMQSGHLILTERMCIQGVTEEISIAYTRFQQDENIDGLTGNGNTHT